MCLNQVVWPVNNTKLYRNLLAKPGSPQRSNKRKYYYRPKSISPANGSMGAKKLIQHKIVTRNNCDKRQILQKNSYRTKKIDFRVKISTKDENEYYINE